MAAKTKSQTKKDVDRGHRPFSQDESDQNDMGDGDEPWGADFGLPKSFAVVNSVYAEEDFGISVVQVLTLRHW